MIQIECPCENDALREMYITDNKLYAYCPNCNREFRVSMEEIEKDKFTPLEKPLLKERNKKSLDN